MNLHKLRKCLDLAEQLVKESDGVHGKEDRRIIMSLLQDREWELYETIKETVEDREGHPCSH